ncbi:MAG: hypothetical protein CL917_12600 [Deltaproteobacteria bacterium]|nr:hypothetical protein [Deltaproteobacteria bacterium]
MSPVDPSPNLSLVSEPLSSSEEATAPISDSEKARSPEPKRRPLARTVPWVLLLVFLGLSVLLWQQFQRAEGLVTQVDSLKTSLLESERRLEIYVRRLDTVRMSVGDLAERVGDLKVLVEADPLQSASIPSAEPLEAAPRGED